jgi:DNA-binding CsgD family transcriptional regulator
LIAMKEQNFKQAYEYKEKQISIHDSLYTTEKIEAVQVIETNFKNYKQEQELIQTRKDNSFRKKLNILYLSLAVLCAIGVFVVYRFFKQKQLLHEKEKKETLLQAKINEEEAINAMMEKELADNEKHLALQENALTQQQRNGLQQALMYNTLQIERKNDLIKELQQHITEVNAKNAKDGFKVDKIVERSIETDEELDFIQNSLLNSNPTFFKILQEKSQHNLTNLDIKYCAYIKMGMSNREIAQIMNVEQKSVRMARYRVKQKLQLAKEEDLDSYMANL